LHLLTADRLGESEVRLPEHFVLVSVRGLWTLRLIDFQF